MFAVPVAEHLGELADQGLGGRQFGTACGDLLQLGVVGVGEVARRGEDPSGDLLGGWRWRWCGNGGVLAQPCGEAAQGAQAPGVAAGAQILMQTLGAAHAVGPSLVQVGQVRIEQARPGNRDVGDQLGGGRGGGITADGFAVQP